MKCKICGNEQHNKPYILREMMFGFKDEFKYFECAECGCFQIENIPQNMEKYYPDNYYSLDQENLTILKLNYFKQLQYDHLSGFKRSFLGAIASFNYNPETYHWFKKLGMTNKDTKILDIGSGSGVLLKQLFQVGFTNLTGIDPYIAEDIIFNQHLRILKKSVFEMDGQFDLIMSHHSLEHMPDHLDVLSRIYRLLNKNGKLLIRIPIMSEPLFQQYGVNMVFLDPPRHFFVHTIKSIKMLLHKAGFVVKEIIYDAKVFDIVASEQYLRDIALQDSRSYTVNKKNSVFSNDQIVRFKKEIHELNKQGKSSSVALFIEKI